MIGWILPRDMDRPHRHQLAFEAAGAILLGGATGSWPLVAVIGLALLPQVRRTWLNWLEAGLGRWRSLGAIVISGFAGLPALSITWTLLCGIGIARTWRDRESTDAALPAS